MMFLYFEVDVITALLLHSDLLGDIIHPEGEELLLGDQPLRVQPFAA